MLDNMTFVWLCVFLITIILEAMTANIVSIWFIPSAFIALILSMIPNMPVYVQVIVFIVLSVVFLILSKTILKKYFRKKPIVPTNLDSVIGKDALVLEDIDNINEKGEVKIDGKIWTARCENNDDVLEKGILVRVKAIQGVKLICERKEK